MNIKVKKKNVPLFESDQQSTQQNFQQKQKVQEVGQVPTQTIETVLNNKSKQFQFDCGVIMARIDVDINNRFGLKWHFNNCFNNGKPSWGDFYSSVLKFVHTSGNTFTSNDEVNLQKQFEKASKSNLK